MVLNLEQFCFPSSGDICQGLEVFLMVTTGVGVSVTGMWQVNARDAAEYPVTHRMEPKTKTYSGQHANSASAEKPCIKSSQTYRLFCLQKDVGPIHLRSIVFFTRVPRPFDGERIVLSAAGSGQLDILM